MEERRVRKKRHGGTPWLIAFFLVVPTVYIGVQFFIMMRSSLKTQTTIRYTMSDSVLCDGVLAMQEITIPVEGSGVLGYQVSNGERVSAGEEIARLFSSESGARNRQRAQQLTEEIDLLERSQSGTGSGADVEALMNRTQQSVYDLMDVLQSNNYASLSEIRSEIQLSKNQLQITTGEAENFNARIEALKVQRDEAESSSSFSSIHAPETGYFVSSEYSEKMLHTPEELAEMTPGQLEEALGQPSQKNDAGTLGKLILDYRWRYYGIVTEKEAQKFTEGARVQLSFPNVSGEALPATVVSVAVDEEKGIAKVEILCDYINEAVVMLEHEKARITFESYTGIRIDRKALHIVDGEPCVYVQFGNVLYKRNIQILFEDSDYILAPLVYEEGVNEIRLFDLVVVEGSDLHDEKIL